MEGDKEKSEYRVWDFYESFYSNSYNLMKHSSVPAYSIGRRHPAEPITTDKLGPSPDTYNIRQEEIIVPARSFGHANRSMSAPKSDNPGPGSYNIPNFLDLSMSSKKNKRGKPAKDRSDKSKIDTPGPASYHPHKPKTVIGYSMGNKTYSVMTGNDNSVGPGQYNANFDSVKPVVSNTIGKGERIAVAPPNVPGPGAYLLAEIKEVPQYVFPREPRGKRVIPDYPGPGEYVIPGLTDELKHKMGKTILPRRPLITKDSDFPGPGAYNVKLPATTPSFSVGIGKRPDLVGVNQKPGPGAYTPNNLSLGAHSKSIGTGLRPPISKDNNTPGPGAYGFNSFTDDGPKYTLVGRKAEAKTTSIPPGPGQYNPDLTAVKPQGIHTVIGTGQRTNESRRGLKGVPGPGAYDPELRRDEPKWTFKKDPKQKINIEDEPGPGQYEIPNTIPDVPKYLLNKAKK